MEDPANRDDSPAAPGVLGLLSGALTEGIVLRLLHNVIDPELGVNIVDLGLVYDVAIDEGAGAVEVEMTLTSPGCPLSGYMDDEIHGQLAQLPQVRQVDVELVWDPAWAPHMMSEAARSTLGWQ
ncbi:MAG: metal-sulfur cluster assembly factor [Solirubrobacteraceae bacterium]